MDPCGNIWSLWEHWIPVGICDPCGNTAFTFNRQSNLCAGRWYIAHLDLSSMIGRWFFKCLSTELPDNRNACQQNCHTTEMPVNRIARQPTCLSPNCHTNDMPANCLSTRTPMQQYVSSTLLHHLCTLKCSGNAASRGPRYTWPGSGPQPL